MKIIIFFLFIFYVSFSQANEVVEKCPEGVSATEKVTPTYPMPTAPRAQEGKVVLELIIEKDGSVSSVSVKESSNDFFISSSVRAVSQWKYPPQEFRCTLQEVLTYTIEG